MNVKRIDFLSALKKCSPGVDMGKVVFDASDCFVFAKGRVYSYNDKISVSYALDLGEEVNCAVKGKELVGVLAKMPCEDIEVTFLKKKMVVKGGEVEASFNFVKYNEGVFSKLDIGDDWSPLGDKFIEALGLCNIKYSNTMGEKRKKVSGVYVDKDTLISSDGTQINVVGLEGCNETFFIHYPFVSDLLKFEGIKEFQKSKAWLHFKGEDGSVVSVRFVDFDREIVSKIKASVEATENSCKDWVKVPSKLFEAVDRASVMSMSVESKNALKLRVDKNCFEVFGEKTSGTYSEKIPMETNGGFVNSEVYVDIDLFKYMLGREYDFCVANLKGNNRLMFKNGSEKHIFSTLSLDKE